MSLRTMRARAMDMVSDESLRSKRQWEFGFGRVTVFSMYF